MRPYGNDMHGEGPILCGIGRRGSKLLCTAIAMSLTCSMPLFATCAGIDRKLIAAMLILSYCNDHGKENLCICGVHYIPACIHRTQASVYMYTAAQSADMWGHAAPAILLAQIVCDAAAACESLQSLQAPYHAAQ